MEKPTSAPLNQFRAWSRSRLINRLLAVRELGVLIAALLIALVFSATAPAFSTTYNLMNLLRQTAELGIVAMAMTILIISGEFDLSVGAIYAVTGVVTGLLVKDHDWNIWMAVPVGLGVALLLGLVNGLLTTKTMIHSFIATLSSMMVFRGIAMVLSKGWPISAFPASNFFQVVGRYKLFDRAPIPILWMVIWGLLMYMLLHRTSYGVKVFATGDNKEAARLAGINTNRVKMINFLITALAAGISGIISMAYLKSVTPTQGTGMELEAIAAAVIGGTALSGGIGSIPGTFLGAFIMAEVRTGLVLLGTDAYVQDAFVGLVIAAAVIINVQIGRRRRVS